MTAKSSATRQRLRPHIVRLVLQIVVAWCVLAASPATVMCQPDFEQEPINYGSAATHDRVVTLQQRLDAGETILEHHAEHGYLQSILEQFDIHPSSQVLVSSKTSFQLRRISPRTPRALYFNDDTYIGWVQHGDVIEVMTTDPQQGEVFYTLSQDEADRPQFVLDRGQCLSCHASSRTQGVPGGLVRSVFVDATGQPQLGSGTFNIDHSSPFEERWGGWYVTGTHGDMRHMGNVIADSPEPTCIDREAGANVTDLSALLDVGDYLTPHSDIVALMVLEHQVQMQNHITRANYECRSASHYDGIMNAALERPEDYVSETTDRRIASVGDKLLKYLLFCDEFRLTAPIEGTSGFSVEFSSRGPWDSQGRSLRDFDLQTRLFTYPCSYMIYSESFQQLPLPVKRYVTQRLHDVLTGKDQSEEFAHLSMSDRSVILQILTETLPDFWEQ